MKIVKLPRERNEDIWAYIEENGRKEKVYMCFARYVDEICVDLEYEDGRRIDYSISRCGDIMFPQFIPENLEWLNEQISKFDVQIEM